MANYISELKNSNGNPAIAVLVRMHDHYSGDLISTTTTNKWGQFSFTDVAEGTYDFRLYGESFTEIDWIYEVHIIDATENSDTKELTAGKTKWFGYSGRFWSDPGTGELPGIDFDSIDNPPPVARGFDDLPPLLDPYAGVVDGRNISRSIYSNYYIYSSGITTSKENNYGDNYNEMNYIYFEPSVIKEYHTLGMFPYVKFPGEDFIIIQGVVTSNATPNADHVALEMYVMGGNSMTTPILSGITTTPNLNITNDYLVNNDTFALSMNISGLYNYATYLIGLRGARLVTHPAPIYVRYLTVSAGGAYAFTISGIYGGGDDGSGSGSGSPPVPSG